VLEFRRTKWQNGRAIPNFAVTFLEVAPGETVWCVILSHNVEWYEVHWFGGRHVMCLNEPTACVGCINGLRTYPRGFMIVQTEGRLDQQVLKITERMWAEEPNFAGHSDLRGIRLRLWKPGKAPKSKTFLRTEGTHPHPDRLPATISLGKALLSVFGKTKKELGGDK